MQNDDPSVDVHLTPEGIQQTEALADKLEKADFEYIFVSELKRTQQTAEIELISKPLPAINQPLLAANPSPLVDVAIATSPINFLKKFMFSLLGPNLSSGQVSFLSLRLNGGGLPPNEGMEWWRACPNKSTNGRSSSFSLKKSLV